MFHIVLVHPEIPPNTGNVIRLAANTGCSLHLVEPLGFLMDDKLLRRAGLDYHEFTAVTRHADWAAFQAARHAARHAAQHAATHATQHATQHADPQAVGGRLWAFTTRGAQGFAGVAWQPGDWLVFGSETSGLPDAVRDSFEPGRRVRLPMRPGQRSLNLSNAVAVVVFEAWRQQGYAGAV